MGRNAQDALSTKKAGAKKGKRANSKPAEPAQFNARVARFIDEYLVDGNGSAAYKRAGYKATGNSAEVNARRLLRNARVAAEIARRQAEVSEAIGVSAQRVLQEAWNIATADANDLVQYQRVCCGACWGAPASQKDRARDPNPACDECGGEGYGRVFAQDTRKLNPVARSLYAGVKVTKDGFEVKMHSKEAALEKLFKHLGLYKKDNEQGSTPLAEALSGFVASLHQAGAKLPIARK